MVTVKELKQQLTDLGVEFPKSGKRKQFYIDLLRENTTSREGGSASGGAGKLKKVGWIFSLSLIFIWIGVLFRGFGEGVNVEVQKNPVLVLMGQGEVHGNQYKRIGNACLIGGICGMWSVSELKAVEKMAISVMVLAVCLFVV